MKIDLWLDDVRPAPDGWVWVKTVDEAKPYFERREVRRASLDHDLGACAECMGGMSTEEWLVKSGMTAMPHCDHFGTGYTLVCWLEETRLWPEAVNVHSANPVGRERMRQVILGAIWRGEIPVLPV